MEKNLTSGSVLRTVLYFSLPYLLSYLLQTLYGMADLYIIGQFCGVESTTAVSIGSQVMHMITVMLVGLAMGTTVRIGRAVGAGDRDDMRKAVGNTIILFAGLAVAVTALLLALVRPIVGVMSTPAAAVPGTVQYLTICFAGIPCITAYNIISAIFRGMGDSKSPLYFIAVACAANIGLDYLFIGALDMGPAGAALGTTLAQAVSVALSLFMICRRRMIPGLRRADCRPDRTMLRSLLQVGLPIAVQDGFIQISFLAITVFANLRGLEDAAAVGIVEKMISFLFLVPSSMLSTVSALSAQNIGAGRPDRARQTLGYAVRIAVGFGIFCTVVMQFAAGWAVGLFTTDPVVADMGAQYMHSYVWDCIFAGIHFSFSGYFCACNRSWLSFVHNSAAIVLVRLPLSWYAATYCLESLFPMGIAAPAGSFLSVLICLAAFRLTERRALPAPASAKG